MVRSLRLLKFRSHKDTRLELCPGMNGIIGISQSGKTNIVRALIWLSTLKPTSKNLVHNREEGAGAKVELETSDGHSISLEKGNKISGQYNIDGKIFRKFGRTVPEEVLNVLNMSTINFHNQLDEPFLVTSKPSYISRVINEITGMVDFDKWIDEVNSRVTKYKGQRSYHEAVIEERQIELDELGDLEEIEPIIVEARMIKEEKEKLEDKYEILSENVAQIQDIRKRIDTEKKILRLAPDLKKIEQIKEAIEVLNEDADNLEYCIRKKKEIVLAKNELKGVVKEYTMALKKEGKCPTCFSPITDKTIERIRSEIHSNQRSSRNR